MALVTTDDLATYLGVEAINEDRAQMLIDDAIAQALAVVSVGTVPTTGATEANLPAGAAGVVRSAVARIYQNPTGVTQEVTGPYTFSQPGRSGSMFSAAELATLRRLAGRNVGAFSITPYFESCSSSSSSSSSS